MQKSPVAVNQQEYDLAYVLGVYFGDASIDKAWTNGDGSEVLRMRLRVIDQDFAERFQSAVEIAFPGSAPKLQLNAANGDKGHFGKQPLHCVTVRRGVPEYIESIAGKKTVIPNIVYRSEGDTRAFIEGLLDSEGWVALVGQKLSRFYLQIGFAMTSEQVYEVQKMLNRMGIKTARIKTKRYPSGKILKTLMFNTDAFIQSGLKFTSARKQRKVDAFAAAREVLKGAGFCPGGSNLNDYKLSLREGLKQAVQGNV